LNLTGLDVGKTLEFDEKINKKSVKIFGKNRKIKIIKIRENVNLTRKIVNLEGYFFSRFFNDFLN